MILVSSFGLQGFESIYSIYVNEVFHFSLSNIALVLTLNGLISLFLQVALFDTFVQRWGERRVIRVCFAAAALCTIWITQAHSKVAVMVATLVIFGIRSFAARYYDPINESKWGQPGANQWA